MDDVGNVIIAQADLLWTVSLALLIVEVLMVARFLTNPDKGLDGTAWVITGLSIGALGASMFLGYLTYGAVVEMVRPVNTGAVADKSFQDAGDLARYQFALFAIGLLLFLLLFGMNAKKIGKAISEMGG